MANFGRLVAAVGALGSGYMQGKKMSEDQDYERERRQRERAEFARQDGERTAAAETIGRIGVIDPSTPDATPYTREQAQSDFVQRMYSLNPTKAMQVEATQMQLDTGRSQADLRARHKRVDDELRAWGARTLKQDQNGAPVLDDDAMVNVGKMRTFLLSREGLYEDALKTAESSMQYATRKIQAETAQRVSDTDKALIQFDRGDYRPALDAYSRYVPDGSRATDVSIGKGGEVTVKRVSAVDGAPLPEVKYKDLATLRATVEGMKDSNAVINHVERTFKHDIESRRVGVAEAAESRANTKDERERTKADAVSKGLADYADAEAKGDAKGMSAARRTILANGGRLDKPEVIKPDVKVGNMGDITVSQPTGGGGVQVTNYGPDMKPKGSVRVPPSGATTPESGVATPKTQADFDKLPSGALYVDPQDGKKYRKP